MSLTASDFEFVRTLLRDRTSIALDDDREYLVDSRLSPVAREHGMADLADLIAALRRGDAELESSCIDAMTTNETSWLRDGEPFRVLMTTLVPDLMTRRQVTRRVTFWSAGCATGQEPYGLAMLLGDTLTPQGWTFGITASDISRTALEQARSGTYRQLEINRGLPASLMVRHFERVGMQWQVSEALRQQVQFVHHNLAADPPPMGRVDIVLLRNVLIYFDLSTRRRILDKVRSVLAPDGVLLLGAAETTLGLSEGWTREVHGSTTFNRPTPAQAPTASALDRPTLDAGLAAPSTAGTKE